MVRDDELARAVYAEAAGIARIVPRAVAVPRDADDVVSAVQWASGSALPLVPRGSGSSMAGGAIGAGVVVDLSRIAAVGEVDVARRRVVVGPGAICAAVDRAAREVGLRLPVDPSSAAFCTVGGMASTNAAGAHTIRFGSVRRWVSGLDCVFDDGSRAWVRRGEAPPAGVPAVRRFLDGVAGDARVAGERLVHRDVRKDSSGYALAAYARSGELVDLLVGSEGTLAIFVGVDVALAPTPGATASLLAAFATLEAAVEGTEAARAAGASACELLDRTFLDVAAAASPLPIPAGTEAVLLIELEAEDAAEARERAVALERALVARTQRGTSHVELGLDPTTEHALWALRHAASPILARLDPTLKSMQFIEDGAVPPALLPEYVRGVRAALASHATRGVIFGHAGDAHVHVNPLVDVSAPDWRERVAGILDDVVALTRRLGGTLSGEHGDGRLRAPLLEQVWPPEALELFARTKHAFDPRGILNLGAKVALPEQHALDEIKYDPALPPLPAPARGVLDRVERERAYSIARLDLLDEELAARAVR